MPDEKGPYKLVQKRVGDFAQTQELKYSIVKSTKDGAQGEFLQEVVPDAGDGWMARRIVRLLNQEWVLLHNRETYEEEMRRDQAD